MILTEFEKLPLKDAIQVTEAWLKRANMEPRGDLKKFTNQELFLVAKEARTEALKRPDIVFSRIQHFIDALYTELEDKEHFLSINGISKTTTEDLKKNLKHYQQELTRVGNVNANTTR